MPRATRNKRRSERTSTQGGGHGGVARPLWTGQLRLALVNVPIILVPATRSGAHIALHQVHAPSGRRIRYDKVVPGLGPVDPDDIKRAVEVSKDHYVVLEDRELDRLKLEAKRTLDLVQFVDHCEIEPLWYERPYFVLPDGELADEPYGVIRDALRSTQKVGIGQFVMRGRDYVAALKPCGNGLTLETLRFADEVRDAEKMFASTKRVRSEKDLLDLAGELIARKAAPFDPGRFHDRYSEALHDLVEAHAHNRKLVEIDDEEPSKGGRGAVELIEALKRSLHSAGAPASTRRKAG